MSFGTFAGRHHTGRRGTFSPDKAQCAPLFQLYHGTGGPTIGACPLGGALPNVVRSFPFNGVFYTKLIFLLFSEIFLFEDTTESLYRAVVFGVPFAWAAQRGTHTEDVSSLPRSTAWNGVYIFLHPGVSFWNPNKIQFAVTVRRH